MLHGLDKPVFKLCHGYPIMFQAICDDLAFCKGGLSAVCPWCCVVLLCLLRRMIPAPVVCIMMLAGALKKGVPSARFGSAPRWNDGSAAAIEAASTPSAAQYGTGKPISVTGAGKRQPAFPFGTARRF